MKHERDEKGRRWQRIGNMKWLSEPDAHQKAGKERG